MKHKTLLLSVLGVLLLVRFVLLPVYEWQQGQVTELANTLERLNDVDALLDLEDEIQSQRRALKTIEGNLQDMFFDIETQNKTSIQKKVEELFSQYNVEIETITWVFEHSHDYNINEYWLEVAIKGDLKDVVKFNASLINQRPNIYVKQMNLRRQRSNQESIEQVQGKITLSMFFTQTLNEQRQVG